VIFSAHIADISTAYGKSRLMQHSDDTDSTKSHVTMCRIPVSGKYRGIKRERLILALRSRTKFDFSRGSAPDPAGSLQRSLDQEVDLRGLLLRGRGREGRGGEERGGERRERREDIGTVFTINTLSTEGNLLSYFGHTSV